MEHSAKDQIINIVHAVERERQIHFEPDEVSDVLAYTMRKLAYLKKGPDYFPLLFKCELGNHAMWSDIKAIGVKNRCHTMSVSA